MGTAADVEEASADSGDPVVDELSRAQRSSFLTSVLLSAGIVVVVGALALGLSALLMREPAPSPEAAQQAAAEADKNIEYADAISRAQDAITRQDWVNVRDYTLVALQARPKDPLALAYKNDAESRLEAALKAAATTPSPSLVTTPAAESSATAPTTTTTTTAPTTTAPTTTAPTTTAPTTTAPTTTTTTTTAPTTTAPTTTAPAIEAQPKPRPQTKPRTSTSKNTSISDDEAKARFERAIDAFRSKDKGTGCKLLEQVAERAPRDSSWRGKADSLYLKRCGD